MAIRTINATNSFGTQITQFNALSAEVGDFAALNGSYTSIVDAINNLDSGVIGSFTIAGTTTEHVKLHIGRGRSGNGINSIQLYSTSADSYSTALIRNAGINGATNLYHTGTGNLNINAVDSADIKLMTTNTDRLVINQDGNIGLGTASPAVQLDQLGDALMHRVRSTSSANAYARYQGTSGIMAVGIVDGAGYVGTTDATDLRFIGNSVELMRLDYATKSLGIGTSSPASNLHIEDSGLTNVQFTSTGSNSNLLIQAANGFASRIWLGDTLDYDVGSIVYNHTTNRLTVTVNTAESLSLDSAGANIIGNVELSGALILNSGTSDWKATVSGNNLYFSYGGTNLMKLDTSGNLQVTGNIETVATIT